MIVSIRDQLGGPRLVSLATWVVSTVFGFFTIVAEAIRLHRVESWGLCAVGLVSVLLPGVFQFVAGRTIARGRAHRPVSPAVVGLILIPTSAMFFVPLSLYVYWADLSIFAYSTEQLPFSIVLGVIWYCALIIVLDLRDSTARLVAQQIAERARVDAIAVKQDKVVEAIEREIDSEVNEELAAGREQVAFILRDHDSGGAGEGRDVAAVLRRIAELRVRPLSHRLDGDHALVDLRPNLRAIVATTVRTQSLRPFEMGSAVLFCFLGSEINAFGFIRGGGLLIAGVIALVAIAAVANVMLERFPSRRWMVLSGTFGLLQLNTFITNSFRNRWIDGYITPAYFVVQVVFAAVLAVGMAALPVWRSSRLGVSPLFRDAIARDAKEACLRGEMVAIAARKAAQLLHGDVQSRLHACAMSIEAACDSGDVNALSRGLDEALRVLDTPINLNASGGDEVATRLSDEVERKVKLWGGLVEIDLEIDSAAAARTGEAAFAMGRLVEEGISNAVRHAAATRIATKIRSRGALLDLTIIDNGLGLPDLPIVASGGLGLALVDRTTRGDWSIERRDGLTYLSASLPVDLGSTVGT